MRSLFGVLCLVALCHSPALSIGVGPANADTLARIERSSRGLSHAALEAAIRGHARAVEQGLVSNPSLLTIIDYTRPSTEPRLWVLDLASGRVLRRELVAHGRNSGDNLPTEFSNEEGSKMSSLGLFVTDETYYGRNGYSLRLRGLDPGINDHAFARAIVMHGADYVSSDVARQLGRLGRSWGCPAVSSDVASVVIDLIKGGTVIYAYGRLVVPPVS